MNIFIEKYCGLPEGRFRDLMGSLPHKLQEAFVLVVPSATNFSVLVSAIDSGKTILRMNIQLPVVSLMSDGMEMPFPPMYVETLNEMELILQEDYMRSFWEFKNGKHS